MMKPFPFDICVSTFDSVIIYKTFRFEFPVRYFCYFTIQHFTNIAYARFFFFKTDINDEWLGFLSSFRVVQNWKIIHGNSTCLQYKYN